MAQWQYHQHSDLSGGENRNLRQVAPNQVMLAHNMVKRVDGSLQTRMGKTKVGTITTPNAQSMLRFQRTDGTESLAVQCSDRLTILQYNGVDDPTAQSEFELNFSSAVHMLFWNSRLLLTNPSLGLYGMTLNPDVLVPIKDEADDTIYGTALAVYGERLYVGHDDLVKCSDLGDATTFDVLNVILVSGGDGDRITALIPLAGGLVICKVNSTWVLYGDSYLDWQLTRAPLALCGATSPWAVACDGLRYMFVGRDNLYSGTLSNIEPLGQTHSALVQDIPDARRGDSFVVSLPQDNGRIVVMLGGTGITLNIETKMGGITSWEPLMAAAGCACGNTLGDDDGKMLLAGVDGIIYKLNGLTDDGTKIKARIIHGYESMGTDRRKQFRRIIPKFGAETPGVIATMMISIDLDYHLENDIGDIYFGFNNVEDKAFEHTEVVGDNFANVHGALEMHSSRGHVMSAMFSSNDRIIYTGYTVKYREVGAW